MSTMHSAQDVSCATIALPSSAVYLLVLQLPLSGDKLDCFCLFCVFPLVCRFKKPGLGTVTAHFQVTPRLLEDIKEAVATSAAKKCEPELSVSVLNEAGEVVAEVTKVSLSVKGFLRW